MSCLCPPMPASVVCQLGQTYAFALHMHSCQNRVEVALGRYTLTLSLLWFSHVCIVPKHVLL